MCRNKILLCFAVFIFLTVACQAEQGFLEVMVKNNVMTDNTPKVIPVNKGWVQFIQGSSANPPTGLPMVDVEGNFTGNANLNNFVGSIATANGGGIRYEGVIGTGDQGDGSFAFGKTNGDLTKNASYFLRYWYKQGGSFYYGVSGAYQTVWGDVIPPFSFDISGFTKYKAAAPYSSSIITIKQSASIIKERYSDPNKEPDVLSNLTVVFSPADSSPLDKPVQLGDKPYKLQFAKDQGFTQDLKEFTSLPFTTANINITEGTEWGQYFKLDTTYYARAVATNPFGSTAGPEISFSLIKLSPGQVAAVSHSLLLTFKRVNVTPNDPQQTNIGINSFSMPVTPANVDKYIAGQEDASWYAETYVEGGLGAPLYGGKPIQNAYDLVNAINEAAPGLENVVSTFGEWIEKGPGDEAMKENGVLIPDQGPDSDQKIKDQLMGIKLKPGKGYQLYLIGVDEVKIKIKN